MKLLRSGGTKSVPFLKIRLVALFAHAIKASFRRLVPAPTVPPHPPSSKAVLNAASVKPAFFKGAQITLIVCFQFFSEKSIIPGIFQTTKPKANPKEPLDKPDYVFSHKRQGP